jgi:hypothetical protein
VGYIYQSWLFRILKNMSAALPADTAAVAATGAGTVAGTGSAHTATDIEAGDLTEAEKEKSKKFLCCKCDCKTYWKTIRDPNSRSMDELMYFIRRHIYVYGIFMLLSFYDCIVAATTAGVTHAPLYYTYAIFSYFAMAAYATYCLGLVYLSRIETPDYLITVLFRALLCVLSFFAFFLFLYATMAKLPSVVVSQPGAFYIHFTCLRVWNVVTRKIKAKESGGMDEALVNTGGVDI